MNRVLAGSLLALSLLALVFSTAPATPGGVLPAPPARPEARADAAPRARPGGSVQVVQVPTPDAGVVARMQLSSNTVALKPARPLPAVTDSTPGVRLIPDAELVYGPTAAGFSPRTFLAQRGGYVNEYVEKILNGETLSGPQIVERVAQQFSVNPRLLIALLEYQGGWVDSPTVSRAQQLRPFGNVDGLRSGKLYLQMTWAASQLNLGYYGRRLGTRAFVQLGDRNEYANVPAALNAGTAGLQNYLAAVQPRSNWDVAMGTGDGSFTATYRRLFGDPWQYDLGTLVPDGTRQPALGLPWANDERWHFTGGPHESWGAGSLWGALDFTPQSVAGCQITPEWVLSMGDGFVTRSISGEVVVSMDPSRDERVGWALLYMHVSAQERVPMGAAVRAGDRIGHASCEGGQAIAAHVHVARKFNGEWIAAAGPLPFVLDGWVTYESPGGEFQGALVKGDVGRQADESRNIALNGVP